MQDEYRQPPRDEAHVRSTVEKILNWTRSAKESDKKLAESCPICLKEFDPESNQQVTELARCKHIFHRDCISEWINKSNTTCPNCRAEI